MKKQVVFGQPSWCIKNDKVKAYVTEKGGHLAPVQFTLEEAIVQPFMIAPWAEEPVDPTIDEVLKVLRGDFFCMPFAGKFMPPDGIDYTCHGEPATKKWTLAASADSSLNLEMSLTQRPGKVTRSIKLVPGQAAVYCSHTVSGVDGPMSYGTHPTLQLPDREGCAFVSVSPYDLGEVAPFPFEDPAQGGYQSLKPGAVFDDIAKVPKIDGSLADLSRYPARKGFEDFVMLRTRQDLPFGWAAVSVPSEGYVWFSLKDPKVLPLSVFWFSNRGRHYAPWNGRNIGVIGMEEACLQLPLGLDSKELFSDCARLSADRALTVNTIMGVLPIDESFGRVEAIEPATGGIEVRFQTGQSKRVAVHLTHLSEAG